MWATPKSRTSGHWLRGKSSMSRTKLAWPLSASWHKTSKRSKQHHAWFPCLKCARSPYIWNKKTHQLCSSNLSCKYKTIVSIMEYQLSWTMRKCEHIRWGWHCISQKRKLAFCVLPDRSTNSMERKRILRNTLMG